MKALLIAGLVVFLFTWTGVSELKAQRYTSVSSRVHFFSDAPMEDIEAVNIDGRSAVDLEAGEVVFSIPIRSFTFEKSLMQEHFNENYMESDKYPNATFQGQLSGFDPSVSNWQKATANGKMKIHGVEQSLRVEGSLRILDQKLEIQAKFPIALKDYNIKIPKVVFYNIAEVVDVTINFNYEKIE